MNGLRRNEDAQGTEAGIQTFTIHLLPALAGEAKAFINTITCINAINCSTNRYKP